MVWPFSSAASSGDSKPAPELDPSLQEFVKQQGPARYETSSASTQTQTPPYSKPQSASISAINSALSSSSSASPTSDAAETDASGRPVYAQRSQFSDGRYDHLWRNYRPIADVEATSKTDQEKVSDLLTEYQARRGNIKTAAMENCSPELFAQWECTNGNSLARRVTMCRKEVQQIGRCLTLQARFLRALGYLAEPGRASEAEEDIQLHADDLYRNMLRQEKAVEEAKQEGREEPVFAPILSLAERRKAGVGARALNSPILGQVLSSKTPNDTPDDPAIPVEAENLRPKSIQEIKETLRPLGPIERALERAAIAQDIQRATLAAQTYDHLQLKSERERQERRDTGAATVGDRVAGIFGR